MTAIRIFTAVVVVTAIVTITVVLATWTPAAEDREDGEVMSPYCWCGGEVGLRTPGDVDGLGCLENVMHDWRAAADAKALRESPMCAEMKRGWAARPTVLGWQSPWSGDDNDPRPRSYRLWFWLYVHVQKWRHRVERHDYVGPVGRCSWCGRRDA